MKSLRVERVPIAHLLTTLVKPCRLGGLYTVAADYKADLVAWHTRQFIKRVRR